MLWLLEEQQKADELAKDLALRVEEARVEAERIELARFKAE